MSNFYLFGGFIAYVILMLYIDLKLLHKKDHTIGVKEALKWSVFWIGQAIVFGFGVWYFKGQTAALEYFTAYVVEESLSIDNLFVFIMIFGYFKVETKYQHRILFWGILGAMIMRAVFIGAGVALVTRFNWVIPLFGVVLIYSGIKLLFKKDEEVHPEDNPVVKLFKKHFPVTTKRDGGKFFIIENGKRLATSFFIVLIIVETTDLIFAVDSIPAVMGISVDPFIIYTSNIFAILGLRSLYFALSGIMNLFHFLNYGLSLVLVFIGVKMIASLKFHVPIGIALGVVLGLIFGSVILSLMFPQKNHKK